MRLIYSVLRAPSTLNQMDLIKKLLGEKGWEHDYRNFVSIRDLRNPNYDAFLWFTLATISFCRNAVVPYLWCKKPKAVYVTVEGVPTKANFTCTNMGKMEFIAVSEYAKWCLEQAEMKVIDVVHHAVDWNRCQELKSRSQEMRAKWDEEFSGRVVFLFVGRLDPRKGLDRLAKALAILNENYKDKYALLLHTSSMPPELQNAQNVLQVGHFGTLSHDEVLAMMGACDYGIFPSVCEGFGLPVLEHNAMSRPVIHAWFPPLSEFSSKDFNFVFDYNQESLVNQGNVQDWIFHEYRPDLLAEMMAQAIDIKLNEKEQYEEYCAKAVEHTKKWDYHEQYSRLLGRLGIV